MPTLSERLGPARGETLFRLVQVAPEDIDYCRERMRSRIGILFPREYIARGTLWSLVNERSRVCGGAIIVHEPPFRSLEGIPVSAVASPGGQLAGKSVAELNGVWLARDWRSPFATLTYWTLLLERLLQTRQDQFLFTFENGNRHMQSFVQWMDARILYSGPTRCLPGMDAPGDETIALVARGLIESVLGVICQGRNPRRSSSETGLIHRLQARTRKPAAPVR